MFGFADSNTIARSYITCTKLSPIIDIYGRCNLWANVNELAGEYRPWTIRILWMGSEDTNHVAAQAVDLFIDIVVLLKTQMRMVFIDVLRRPLLAWSTIAPLLTLILSIWWWLHGLFSIKKFDKSFRAHIILIPMYVKITSVQPLPGCRSDGQFTFRVKK